MVGYEVETEVEVEVKVKVKVEVNDYISPDIGKTGKIDYL
jgi:hypothetical protein